MAGVFTITDLLLRLVLGAVLATVVFLLASNGLKFYLQWITGTGYTYGALATPIAFLLFTFFMGFAVVIGAELNNAIQEQWPAPPPHAHRFRWWLKERAEGIVSNEPAAEPKDEARTEPRTSGRRRTGHPFLSCS